MKIIVEIFCFIGRIFVKIGGFFKIVWSLLTETISNHCPPIDFIFEINDWGLLNYDNKKNRWLFYPDGDDHTIIINDDQFPDGFKPSKAKKGKRAKVNCSLCTKDIEYARRRQREYYYSEYLHITKPAPVYNIEFVVYESPKKRKTKLSSENSVTPDERK